MNYQPPSPLITVSGKPVKSALDFYNLRRPEILKFYEDNVFGSVPPRPEKIEFELLGEKTDALNNTAIRREYRIHAGNGDRKFSFDALMYLPKNAVKVPCITALNFCGNCGTTQETDLVTKPAEKDFAQLSRWNRIFDMQQGFAVITAARNGVYYDAPDFDSNNTLWGIYDDSCGIAKENRTAISAWGAAYSLLYDLAAAQPEIDAKAVWVHGHSRLGKTALWIGANDTRFAGVVSNCSGCAGAALFYQKDGENIEKIATRFPYWFVKKFQEYKGRDNELSFDQNWLLSLIAPRPLLVVSAQEDAWAGPANEFADAQSVSEVYRLFGAAGLPAVTGPAEVNHRYFGEGVGYCMRTGKHDVTDFDWDTVTQFIRHTTNR